MDNTTLTFATETTDSLNNRGITQVDFCAAFAGSDVTATLVGYQQDAPVYELTGAEVRYAILTNGDTVYADDLGEIEGFAAL